MSKQELNQEQIQQQAQKLAESLTPGLTLCEAAQRDINAGLAALLQRYTDGPIPDASLKVWRDFGKLDDIVHKFQKRVNKLNKND